jgi:nitrate reductase delta subunit
MMHMLCLLYDTLADLLRYPGADYPQRLEHCRRLLATTVPEALPLLERFQGEIAEYSPKALEELYTPTFDLNPVCPLEVGWHLFGEDYSRGQFLVLMRQELRSRGLPETVELPDHLTHILPSVARMEQQHADRFTTTYLLPALQKMLTALAARNSPYQYLLEVVRSVLLSPFSGVRSEEQR